MTNFAHMHISMRFIAAGSTTPKYVYVCMYIHIHMYIHTHIHTCRMDDANLQALSAKYQRTPAQLLIRWCLAKGCVFFF